MHDLNYHVQKLCLCGPNWALPCKPGRLLYPLCNQDSSVKVCWFFGGSQGQMTIDDPVATGTRRGLLLLWRARSLPRWRTGNLRLWAGPASMISMGVWACWRGWLYSRISSLKCGMLTPCWRLDRKCEWVLEYCCSSHVIYHIHL